MDKIKKFALALSRIKEAGLLSDPDCKAPIKEFVRKATEASNYHTTTHYRSEGVCDELKKLGRSFSGRSEYHTYCSQNFCHEHIVPVEAVYKLLLEAASEQIEDILRRYTIRATITKEENGRLTKDTMPKGFYVACDKLYREPLARYIVAVPQISLSPRIKDFWVWS